MNIAFHVLFGIAISYIIITCFEWYIHRFHMHGRGFLNRFEPTLHRNHILHHAYYSGTRQVVSSKSDFSCLSGIGLDADIRSSLKLAVPVALVMCPFLPIEAGIFLLFSIAHPLIWTAFHLEIHKPEGRWFSHSVWYEACLHNHQLHHLDTSTHYCVVFLGADYLFGTWAKG